MDVSLSVESPEEILLDEMAKSEIVSAISDFLDKYAVENPMAVEFVKGIYGIDSERLSVRESAMRSGISFADAMSQMSKFAEAMRKDMKMVALVKTAR